MLRRPLPRALAARLLALSVWLCPAAFAAGAPTDAPADLLFQPPTFLLPQMAPDGTRAAALSRFDAKHYGLVSIDLATRKVQPLARSPDYSALNFWWKTDDLLLVLLQDEDGARMFRSLDCRTGALNPLRELVFYETVTFLHTLPDSPDEMLFSANAVGTREKDVLRVNLRTGKITAVERDPVRLNYWLVGRRGEVVAGWAHQTSEGAPSQAVLLWRESPKSRWQTTVLPKGELPPFVPVGVAEDGRRLVIEDFRQSDVAAVALYDPATGETQTLVEPQASLPSSFSTWGFDPVPGAVAYQSEATETHFLNTTMQEVDAWVAKALPQAERTYLSFSRDDRRAVLFAHNNRNPGVYCWIDIPTKKVAVLGVACNGIDPKRMAASQPFHFQARSGEKLTGWITLPPGADRPPVIVHTGNGLGMAKATGEFNALAQYFSQKGFAFVQVNVRGTPHISRTFSALGDFQIARMADDIEDAIGWLGSEGLIDPKRVAALGAHYGALVAYQLAIRPGSLRALAVLEAPLHLPANPTYYATSTKGEAELAAALGGTTAVETYSDTVAPLELAPKLAVPSLHYYDLNALGRRPDGVNKLEARLKALPQPYELVFGTSEERKKKEHIADWQDSFRAYEAISRFFTQHVGK